METTNITKQPFDYKQFIKSDGEKKLVLKLSSAFRHIKSYRRDLPQAFEELLALVQKFHKAQVTAESVKITYTGSDGVTAITNDGDLKKAYDFANASESKELKLQCESEEFGRGEKREIVKAERPPRPVIEEKKEAIECQLIVPKPKSE